VWAALLAMFMIVLTIGAASASSIPKWAIHELLENHPSSELVAPKVGNGVTRFVYLYPTDRPFRSDYFQAVQNSLLTLRNWYRSELGQYSPTLPQSPMPLVQVLALNNPASFYGTNNPGGAAYLYFWNNVLQEVMPRVGAQFNDPANAWVFFVDAPAGCGQLSGGGTSGIAVMSHNDLRGLLGHVFLECDGTPNPGLTYTPQRWIGGQGHELGHAYGLPHPPGCDDGLPSCDYNALMWAGFYTGFPQTTYLRADNISTLLSGTYVALAAGIFDNGFE